jgi:hypothetical protein
MTQWGREASMRLREWSGNRLITVLAAGWCAAFVFAIMASETGNSLAGLVAFFLCCGPCVIATVWSWNRIEVGRWHWGKILLLWALLGVVAVMFGNFREAEQGWQIIPLLLGGIPLLVLTWAWLTAHEKQ